MIFNHISGMTEHELIDALLKHDKYFPLDLQAMTAYLLENTIQQFYYDEVFREYRFRPKDCDHWVSDKIFYMAVLKAALVYYEKTEMVDDKLENSYYVCTTKE